MNNSDFITVFNLSDLGYRTWWFPAFGLIFVAIGSGLFIIRKVGFFPVFQRSWKGKWFPYFYLGFAIFWTVTAFISTFGQYRKDVTALSSGTAGYVEGDVTNFIPMPYNGHAQESFTVRGVPFKYSDYEATNGFNRTASHGGPIHSGLYVRIWYLGNDILKLQVLKNKSN